MDTLLILWHSRTHTAKLLAESAYQGALWAQKEIRGKTKVNLVYAPNADLEQLLNASSYLFCAPENLGGLSGAMKEFFDLFYYALLGKIEGRPYSALVAAGSDGEGALRQLRRICTGWRLNEKVPSHIITTQSDTPERILSNKVLTTEQKALAWETGATLSALMS